MEEFDISKLYKIDKKSLAIKYGSITATSIIVGGSLFMVSSCSRSEDQWAETAGKAGYINLEAVEEAMKKSDNVSDFEKRVNEIYQGDEVILIEVKNEDNGEQLVSGYADLNENGKIDYDEDEKLFTFRRWYEEGNQRGEMRGYGVNSYYYRPYPTGIDFLTTWLLFSALSRPAYMVPVYHTTISDVGMIKQHRANYRSTPSYREQLRTNRDFHTRMSTTYGTTYRQASPSANRQRWATRKGVNLSKSTRISSRGFGRSSWGSSRSWGSRSSFGGFSGGGSGGGLNTCSPNAEIILSRISYEKILQKH